MKIFNAGISIKAVMFACNNCGAAWSATDTWNPKTSNESYFNWKDKQPKDAVFYSRSKTGKTFRCECPNCHEMASTPAALHDAYTRYISGLEL